eukprot:TRINITY_DN1873_c0_g1_i1.p1 TRINITY_DN1873_c0_g1~~TRINITY_DN1873_c0_g1_i1.p1  ORF type:complete len:170 (+),score=58.07 TRINITY_DN1873_c0_g1_i1:25-510(+)
MKRDKRAALSLEVPDAPLRMHADNLQEAIRTRGKALVLLDVRGEDYPGGHITGSINVPYDEFGASLEELVEAHRHADRVVVYCMSSQVRSPSCAAQFLARLAEIHAAPAPEVFVLIGGFAQWVRGRFKDPTLVTDFDEKLWRAIWEATDASPEAAPADPTD